METGVVSFQRGFSWALTVSLGGPFPDESSHKPSLEQGGNSFPRDFPQMVCLLPLSLVSLTDKLPEALYLVFRFPHTCAVPWFLWGAVWYREDEKIVHGAFLPQEYIKLGPEAGGS